MKTTAIVQRKKSKARAWNAGGWHVFFRDGRADWSGARDAAEAIAMYPEKVRRHVLAVVLADAFPRGTSPVAFDLAFVVVKTRVPRSHARIPIRPLHV